MSVKKEQNDLLEKLIHRNLMKFFTILFILLSFQLIGQTNYGIFTGKVTDEQGNPLLSANIVILETSNGAATEKNGRFRILSRPGTYNIEITFMGFEKVTDHIVIKAGETLDKNYKLISNSFTIGTITVTAENNFIPLSPETKTNVSSGDLEHLLASSLNDAMKLAPGVETTNPTLNNVEQATIRGGDPIGTQIILNGIPITNNANMQVGIGYTSANSGTDLRSIPAENVNDIEIIRGIPSAKYGDLTDGLLIVNTKSTPDRLKVKMKYNPLLSEANISAGTYLADWVVNGNLNIASSDRDVRITGDGYTRVAGQLTLDNNSEGYNFKNVLYFTHSFDDYKEQPGYALRDAWYNHDINLKYSADYSRIFDPFTKLSATLSVSYTNQNSYDQQLVSRDNIVITDRTAEGTQPGRIVFGSYLGKEYIKGDVWNIYSDINYNSKFFTGSLLHSLLYGITYRNDFNKGDGIIFDPLYPPSAATTMPRLRNYSSIPSYNILSFYAEDKLTGNILKPFTLQAGIRYETYRPKGFDIKGLIGKADLIQSNNGSFLNPRINFSINLFKDSQIRLGYGVTSKSPPMGMIFANKKYFDIVDTVSVVNPQYADSNFSMISTYIREQANSQIKGYTQKKYEISFDQQFDFGGFSVTGYVNDSKNMFESIEIPTVVYKQSYPNGADQTGAYIKDTLLETYQQYSNSGWAKVNGVEFTLTTKKFPIINTIFKFDASYTYSENGLNNGYYYDAPRYVTTLGVNLMPLYHQWSSYSKNLLLNYRFDIQVKALGIWLTLQVQQKVVEIDNRIGYGDILAAGYYTSKGELIIIPEAERSNPKYAPIQRSIEPFELYEENRPDKWLFNLNVSKSLWTGAAVSFFVNNFFNNQPLYQLQRSSPTSPTYERRNPELFYGLDFNVSM
ncbi:MAG: TonB-dependent receptor [Ignavibacteriaceae bacterium]|nr:TonB-dependent receptor [Ignavibacteriaceae bacterium]